MKSRFFSSFAVGLTVLFYALSLTSVNAQCNYTLEANDSWGDGWNGNTMDVLVNGAVVLDDVTFTSGTQATFNFAVNTGDQITTLWNGGGGFGSETSYRILDVTGAEVGSGAQTSITTAITASCPSCQPPTSPIVFGITPSTVDYPLRMVMEQLNSRFLMEPLVYTWRRNRVYRLIYEYGIIRINCSNEL